VSGVYDHPHAYAIGFRDVIAAWLLCLVIGVTGIAAPTIVAAAEDFVAEACAAPLTPVHHHASRPAPPASLRS